MTKFELVFDNLWLFSLSSHLYTGLGDRHPSNLMIDKLSGRVLHIDFGEFFFDVCRIHGLIMKAADFQLSSVFP